MRDYSSLLLRNRSDENLLKGVFATLDGARIPCAKYTDPLLENAIRKGFIKGHEVTNLFVWNFYGEIIYAAVNFPGSWNNSRLVAAEGLYYPFCLATRRQNILYWVIKSSSFNRNPIQILFLDCSPFQVLSNIRYP